MRVNGFKLLQEDTLYFYFLLFSFCVVHQACSLFNVNSSYQTVVYICWRQYFFYLISILKTFIIIIIDAYEFYFRHYSLCYRPMLEDHYLKIPICNELFYSNLVFRDLYVYIYVCILTLTLEKKDEVVCNQES